MSKEPRIIVSQGRYGPPQDGWYANQVEPGEELHSMGHGVFVNVGSAARPIWRRKHATSPAGGAKLSSEWKKIK